MNIALVMERIEPWRGGAETSTHQFMQHLLSTGHELEIFTRSRLSPAPGIKVHTVPSRARTRAGRTASFSRAVDRRLADARIDLVHAISPCTRADIYEPRGGTVVETIARNLALRRSGPSRSLKQLANRFNLRQRLILDLERRLLLRRPRPVVVALSEYVARQLRTHYDFPDSHIRLIFNGVDPDSTDQAQRLLDRSEIRRLYGIGEDELLVLLVAHNFKLKGVPRWIEALARLVRSSEFQVQSLVVGRDSPFRWQRLAAAAGVGDRIQFTGPTRRIGAFYHAADLLVHPTYYDPCSRVVLEAMVAGLPCVTTRFDGASEVIEDGISGFVLPSPEDRDELVQRVRLLAKSQARHEMGEAAVRAGQQASMRRHAQQIAALYAEVGQRRAAV
ncbi:MAG: glycosyltransferase family 4 protein [Planctomycetota bacterium]